MKIKNPYLLITMVAVVFIPILSCTMAGSFFGETKIGETPQKVKDIFVEHPDNIKVDAWVKNMEVPWSLVFLPNGDALVSERSGKIKIIKNGILQKELYALIPNVKHRKGSEAGLMGLALHPDFKKQPYVYAMFTYDDGNSIDNRIVRLKHQGNTGMVDNIVIKGIPAGQNHNGGRIKFGPDGMLYVTTGETFIKELAQDMKSLGGKILRLMPDGTIPDDNPFPGSAIYSLGHRNPQGLAWHPTTGDLFSSEHGPSGEMNLTGKDEINIIKPGRNYGWPTVVGKVNMSEFEDPIILWESATPPSGMVFWNNELFVATLRSKALINIKLDILKNGYKVTAIERWFSPNQNTGTYGRLRDVTIGPDNKLYLLTNNRDGRGNPEKEDDKILTLTSLKK